MKKGILLAALFCVGAHGASSIPRGEQVVIDEIVAILYHPGGTDIVLRSDLKKSLDGRPFSLRDILTQRLMVLDAQSMNITISQDDAERFLGELQKMNHLTRDEMIAAFADQGFSYQEGIEQLRRRQMVEQIIDLRIRSDKTLMITKQEVAAFDEQNPQFDEATFTLAQAFIPAATWAARAKQLAWSDAELSALVWGEPFVIRESELADDKRGLADAAIGGVVDTVDVGDGAEITRLLAKTPRRRYTVDERYTEIATALFNERFMRLLHEYENKLLEETAIKFTYPEDQQQVFAVGEDKKEGEQ